MRTLKPILIDINKKNKFINFQFFFQFDLNNDGEEEKQNSETEVENKEENN